MTFPTFTYPANNNKFGEYHTQKGVMKTSVKWTPTASTTSTSQWWTSTSGKAQSGRRRPVENLSLTSVSSVVDGRHCRRQADVFITPTENQSVNCKMYLEDLHEPYDMASPSL